MAAPSAQPTPKPTPAMDKQWKCEINGLSTDGHSSDAMPSRVTVGTKLFASCDGETASLAKVGLKIELNDQQEYALHIWQVLKLTDTHAELVVVPWRAGDFKLKNPALTDAKLRVGMGDMDLTVATVIDPKQNPEGKAYPPWRPLDLAWPLWLWILAASVCCGIAYLLLLGVRKSLKRKKLLALLEQNATALSPVNHLNKELRKLQRKIPLQGQPWPSREEMRALFNELDSQFRWFLARELVIGALDGSVRSIMREMKKADADVFKHNSREVRVALTELKNARSSDALSGDDALQLMDLTRKVADKIAKERNV